MQTHLAHSTGCGLKGRPLYWQSSTAQAWCVISAGSGSFRRRGPVVCPALPGRRASLGRQLPSGGAAPAGALPGRASGSGGLLVTEAHVALLLPAKAAVAGSGARMHSFQGRRNMQPTGASAGSNQTDL